MSLRSDCDCLLSVFTLDDAIKFDDACNLVDMHSDFFDVGIRVDILVQFHLIASQLLLQGTVLSQILHFVLVEHLQCYQVEIQICVLFGGIQADHQITFLLHQVDIFQGLI